MANEIDFSDLEGVEEERQPEALDFSDIEGVEVEQPGKVEALGRGFAQGITFGFADELGAMGFRNDQVRNALAAVKGEPRAETTYEQRRDEARAQDDAASRTHPWTFGGGQVAGALLPAIATGGQSTVAGRVGSGVAQGAASGLGMSKADDAKGLARDTATGALLGGAFSAGAEGLRVGVQKGAQALRGVAGKTGQAFQRRSLEATAGQADEAAKAAKGEAQQLGNELEALPERMLAEQAKREVANVRKLVADAKTAASMSDEATRLAEAEAALKVARESQKAAGRALDMSAEKEALDALEQQVKAARANATAAKKAWQSSPQATHMREAAEDAAFAAKRLDTLKELRRLIPDGKGHDVQAATRKAWDVRKGWDETQASHLLPPEARAFMRHLDKEALQTIRDHGLTPSIERTRKMMKAAERKVATSRKAAEQAEAAARETIQRAERVRLAAENRLAQAVKDPTTKGLRESVDAAKKSVQRAQEAVQKAQSEAQMSKAMNTLRAAEAGLEDAERQAARLGAESVMAERAIRGPLEAATGRSKSLRVEADRAKGAVDAVPESMLSRGMKRVSERVRGDDMVDLGALSMGAIAGGLAGGLAGGGFGALAAPVVKGAVQNFLRNPQQTQAVADVLLRAAQQSPGLALYSRTLTSGLDVGSVAGAREMLERHLTLMEADPAYRAEVEQMALE